MFNIILYIITIILLILSFIKDRRKTMMALKKALKSFENMLPQFLAILIIIGVMLSVVKPEFISSVIGQQSGVYGMMAAGMIGSITLIPAFVAFPLASALLTNGAGIMQIAVFISTLMMVGVVTLPLETSYFGRKATLIRNGLAFLYSFIVALLIGVII